MSVITDVQEHTQEYISEEVQRFGQVAAGFSDADFDQFLLKLRDTYEQNAEGEILKQVQNDETLGVQNDEGGVDSATYAQNDDGGSTQNDNQRGTQNDETDGIAEGVQNDEGDIHAAAEVLSGRLADVGDESKWVDGNIEDFFRVLDEIDEVHDRGELWNGF